MTPTDALLLPFHLLSLASGAKSFRDNPVIGSRKFNELGLHKKRLMLAENLAKQKRQRLRHLLTPENRETFDQNGYVVIENVLPEKVFKQLLEEVEQHRFQAREMKQGQTVTRFITLPPAILKSLPALETFVYSDLFQGLLKYGAAWKADPLFTLHTVFSPGPDSGDPQSILHSDTFHAAAKGWFFLHDVALEDGPFSYVPGSHYATPERIAWEQEQSLTAATSDNILHALGSFRVKAEDLEKMGYPSALPLAVPANTLVVADTHGFHARLPSLRPSVRLALYASSRGNPFQPWTGFDLLSLPGLKGRRAQLLDLQRDLLSRLTGKADGQPPVGLVFPTDAPIR